MRQDWISPWWQAVNLPERWDVCGVVVPSLSVWHTFALENIGNAYLCGGAANKDAAASLLAFASTDYKGGRRLISDAIFRKRAIAKVVKLVAKTSDESLRDACSEYVTVCLRGASRWQRGDSRNASVPYQWHIVYRLTGGDVCKLEAAWNTPYAVARCLSDAAAEQGGDDSIMQPKAQEMEDNWGDYKHLEGEHKIAVM